MNDLVAALRSGRVLVMDGAMGTQLQRLTPNFDCCERFNLSDPAAVRSIHRVYREAGAEVLLTNTFQANPVALARRGLAAAHHEIWQAAIKLIHAEGPGPFVLADVGPIDNLTREIVTGILRECKGVDGVLLETWSSLEDLAMFAQAASVPLLVSFTYDREQIDKGRPEACARAAQEYGVVAVGANCGKDIDMTDLREIIERYRAVCDLPIFVRPNAGTPARTETGWVYPRDPQAMAADLPALLTAGIAMIGGCCGTTPEHIAALRLVVEEWNRSV